MTRRLYYTKRSALLVLLALPLLAQPPPDPRPPGNVQRVVIFKLDGVNADLLDQWLARTDERTGRSLLPWINEIFIRQGTRIQNFFVRGISLSAPSWSSLDSGRHQVIHGNVEYDRWTLHAYDYLNFFPFYLNYSQKKQVDMPGTEVLDEAGIPLLLDAFQPAERWQSYQLYQRGNDWRLLGGSIPNHFRGRSPKDWFDEWESGLELTSTVQEEEERQIERAMGNAQVFYLDFYSGDWDHVAHLTNDPESQLRVLQSLDAAVGRLWSAARASPLGARTLFVLVSDHGMNTNPRVMSQGYSLVNWFTSAAGGAQHVITDRHPLEGYKLRGLDPFVHKVLTVSPASSYLKNDAQHYPTVLMDLDGNERAAIQLRSNAWNVAQVLLTAAADSQTPPEVKKACRSELSRWAEAERARWEPERAAIQTELEALARSTKNTEANSKAAQENDAGRNLDRRRLSVRAADQRTEEREYRAYIAAVDAFLAMPANAGPTLVPAESLGPQNALYDLQNYVTGPAGGGVVLNAAGRVDPDRSFRRMNYVAELQALQVRNQVQKGISNRPVDFSAAPLDPGAIAAALGEPAAVTGAIWLYRGQGQEAVILYRQLADRFEIRYVPVENLRGFSDGSVTAATAPWTAGLPLEIFEDSGLRLPGSGSREGWLSGWHTDREWLDALCGTRYTDGLIGLTELFRPPEVASPAWTRNLSEPDRRNILELARRRRKLVAPDFEVFASDHWNFNVRNFNSGGNHGSFLRASSHSVLMFSGGNQTGIPKNATVTRPYDSLSLVPTILELMKRASPGPPPAGTAIPEVTDAAPIMAR